jgi:hypothetical protein
MKIPPCRRTDMTKLVDALYYFANAPKIYQSTVPGLDPGVTIVFMVSPRHF